MSDHIETIREALKRGGELHGYYANLADPGGPTTPFTKFYEAEALAALDALASQLAEAERERDEWHGEYVAACKSLTKRVHQGAQAVYRAERAEAQLAEAERRFAALEQELVAARQVNGDLAKRALAAEAQLAEAREALQQIRDGGDVDRAWAIARDALERLGAEPYSTKVPDSARSEGHGRG